MNAYLDLVALASDDGKKLYAAAEIGGAPYVDRIEVPYALHLHLVECGLEAVGKCGKYASLVGGVEAVYVELRIRLGVAELLRIGEDLLERTAFILHPREDVVARAVEDSVD